MIKRILLYLLIVTLTLTTLVSCGASSGEEAESASKTEETKTEVPETETAIEDETTILTNYDNMVLKFTYGEDEYYTVRKTLWTEDFDMGLDFKYLGEIGEEVDGVLLDGILVPQDGTTYVTEENSFVPAGTPVFIAEDESFVRVAFDGIAYYLRLTEDKAESNDSFDGERPPMLYYNGELYKHTLAFNGGELWEFKLDEDWSFVGFIRSEILANDIYPEYNIEADFHLGKPVYYNEKLDRIAILVEDDDYTYSDVDWEILERIETRLPND